MGVDGIITNDPRLFEPTDRQVAALKPGGSAPARLVCPAVVGARPDASTVLAAAPLEVDDAAQRDRGLARRRASAGSSRRPGAPLRRCRRRRSSSSRRSRGSTHCLLALFMYCRRKLMYILSCAWPSPGIEPRMPTVFGWSAGLQTSIVAHSSRELQQRMRARRRALSASRSVAAAERRDGRRAAPRRRASAASSRLDLEQDMRLKIAPRAHRDSGGRARCGIPCERWGRRAQRRWSSCSGACRCSRRSSTSDLERIAQLARAARSSSRARPSSARATRATPATSCARATRARSAATATGARSRSRRSDRATSSASSRCSRTSAAPPPSKRSSRRASSACSAPTCAG